MKFWIAALFLILGQIAFSQDIVPPIPPVRPPPITPK